LSSVQTPAGKREYVLPAAPAIGAELSDYEIRRHYELPSEFYALWLDPTMAYTCALYEEGDDLRRAQERKLDWLARAAGVREGARVLDVGCGWGGMLRRLVESHRVREAVGITISAEQARFVRERTAGLPIEVLVQGWETHRPEEPYDAIVSAGAFEHFARDRASREARLDTYRAFFARCHELLRPGGYLGLQSVAKGGARLDRAAIDDFRIVDEAFPESAIPWPAEIFIASERHFDVRACVFHDEHYVPTIGAWLERLEAVREQGVAMIGQERFDLFVGYLEAARRRLSVGHATLMRLSLRRIG
jgi:cyclopropane-fatty-acyl-phospholipid synthase